jgi:hypothetical protein
MQALKLLFREKPAADVQAALPSWAYLFSRLVLDSNRSVRSEACHVTATAAATVGRGIAPLLKSLLPSWWLAQFDGYSEAAAAAKAAFAAAFPAPAKQRDAVLFCRAEVEWLPCILTAACPAMLPLLHSAAARAIARHSAAFCCCHSCTCLALSCHTAPGRAMKINRLLRKGSDRANRHGCHHLATEARPLLPVDWGSCRRTPLPDEKQSNEQSSEPRLPLHILPHQSITTSTKSHMHAWPCDTNLRMQ